MDEVLETWSWFAGFPFELAEGLGGVVIGANVVMAILVILLRRRVVVSAAVQWTPLALYGFAWCARWSAPWAWLPVQVSGVLLIIFSMLTVVSLVWSVVNIVRVLAGK